MQYWICKKGNDKLIVIDEEVIYNNNPSESKLVEYKRQLQKNKIPEKLTGTPIRYIRKIRTTDTSNTIKIFSGENNETEIDAREHKLAILNYLKENDKRRPQYLEYPEAWYSVLKKPIITLLVIIGLTYYLYDLAYFMELGFEYELTGRRSRGIAIGGILLSIAETLGTAGVIVLGSVLGSITAWLAWRNYRLKRTVYELDFRR